MSKRLGRSVGVIQWGVVDQRVRRRGQRVLGEQGMEIAVARQVVLGQEIIAAPGEQDARFLERLADGGDAERLAQRGVRRLHPATGEDQRAAREVDGAVAHDHEDFQPVAAVAQQQDGAGRARRSALSRHGYSPRG